MALPPQKFREIVFQLLYGHDLGKPEAEEMVGLMMKELRVTRRTVQEARARMEQVWSRVTELDALLAQVSHAYDFHRIQTVERNVLRLGVYEMLFDDAIPPSVAIAEAMRLTRKFGTPEAANFVNALLDSLRKRSQGEALDEAALKAGFEELDASQTSVDELSRRVSDEPE